MIPKIVHTFWFGRGPKPSRIQACIDSQRTLLPGYRHIEWNEDNFSLDQHPAIAEAAANRRWAHVSDYARLHVLSDHGGIYFDTDVEVRKSFDPLLNERAFLGYMWDCNLGTAVIGAEPGHPIVKGILAIYEDPVYRINFEAPNNDIFTRYFIDHVPGFTLNGYNWRSDIVTVFDKYTFEHPRFTNDNGFSIHHFDQSWKAGGTKKQLTSLIKKALGIRLYRKYVTAKSLRISPFRDEFHPG